MNKDAKPEMYHPMQKAGQLVIDAINIGLAAPEYRDNAFMLNATIRGKTKELIFCGKICWRSDVKISKIYFLRST
ncbi:MAG: hypothetical protein NC517_10330 [Firmicutes bacterium]|nr:hypothetical protein [Bacillota bacterium]